MGKVIGVCGRGKCASRSIITILQGIIKRGGVNRANALSPSTAKILPIYLKETAGIYRLLASRSGACRTLLLLKGAASARSVSKRILRRESPNSLARRRMHSYVRSFVKRCSRVPPVCSTLGIGKGGLCRLTHRKGAIRHGDEGIRVRKVHVLRVGLPRIHVRISYSGKACVHALYRSVKRGLRINNYVRRLRHAGINHFLGRSTMALSRMHRGVRRKRNTRLFAPLSRVFTRLPTIAIASTGT